MTDTCIRESFVCNTNQLLTTITDMKVIAGILLVITRLFPVHSQGIIQMHDNNCDYFCPVVGIFPVCGTDGRTYPSLCHLECLSSNNQKSNQEPIDVLAQGRCREEQCVCSTVTDPVCGTNGWTYPNVCQLECESKRLQRYNFPSISLLRKGECPGEGCSCRAVWQPVCGTDGRTYGNTCELRCASERLQTIGRPPIFLVRYGKCPASPCDCPQFISPVCGTNGISYRSICFLECDSKANQQHGRLGINIRSYGLCTQEFCLCPNNASPVCATDGNTYDSECSLRCANSKRFALGQPPLATLSKGTCKDCPCSKKFAPVCGSDGRTFLNLCELQCENQRRQQQRLTLLTYTVGECACNCPAEYKPICVSDFGTYRNLCFLGCENRARVHKGYPPLHATREGKCGCYCSTFDQPVCGSDRRTYRNICWFNCANFYLLRNARSAVFVIKNGPC